MDTEKEKKYKLYDTYKDCCGCSACLSICPVKAIKFEYNNEGFLYPKIDYKRCIGCNQCREICTFKMDKNKIIKNEMLKLYAVKHKNSEIIKRSSSGGAFTALSDYFLKSQNAVASCTYDYEIDAMSLKIYNDSTTRDSARGSKYIQAELYDGFIDIKLWLINNPNKKIMIVGTGCQIAALDLYLRKNKLRDNALLVDLICHGVASSKLWKDFIEKIKGDKKVQFISFKDKKFGWHFPSTYVMINSKKIKIDNFSNWFYMSLSLRESCYECPYTQVNRKSDITIGDFWGIEKNYKDFADRYGVSLLMIHTNRGQEIFEKIKKEIVYIETDINKSLQPRLNSPEKVPIERVEFWKDIRINGIDYCSKKYTRSNYNSWYRILIRYLKETIKKIIK